VVDGAESHRQVDDLSVAFGTVDHRLPLEADQDSDLLVIGRREDSVQDL